MIPLSSRLAYAATVGFIALGALRIVSTYPIFSQTVDEPSHIAGGLEWLDRGSYWFEPKHPPLARVALAVGPYLSGVRLSDSMPQGRVHFGRVFREGNALLETGRGYDRNLALARLGNLLFFVLGCLAVYWLTVPLLSRAPAVGAVAFASSSPMLLAHAGLATTDMASAATLLLALVALLRYVTRPGALAAAWLGAAIALPLATKLSAVLFLPVAGLGFGILALLTRDSSDRPLRNLRLTHVLIVAGSAFLVLWAIYRFSVGTPLQVDQRLTERITTRFGTGSGLGATLLEAAHRRIVPAVEWFAGVKDLLADNAEGRKAYLLGTVYQGGNPAYFPIGLLVKTPLPLVILEFAGLALAFAAARQSRRWILLAPAAAAAAILAVSLPSQINIGTRHVLPVFLLVTPYAGAAITRLLAPPAPGKARAVAAVLLAWYAWSTVRVHPDYLAYFNELAWLSRDPLLINSDLDWGQDAKRLVRTVNDLGIDSLHVVYFGSTNLEKRGLKHFDTLNDYTPVTGWVAASINPLLMGRSLERASDQFAWLKALRPYRTVGRSILLYHIPPA